MKEKYHLLKDSLKKVSEQLKIVPKFIQNQGSTGIKQTHLRGASDLDIFVGLNPKTHSDAIDLPSKQQKQALKNLFLTYVKDWFIPAAHDAGFHEMIISYAEHPYLTISDQGYDIDIVGCFDLDYDHLLKHGPITAVDRTPWHSKIIADRLTHFQKQEVRLLKAFFQANYVYGDKTTLGRLGFTGFSAEVLILLYHDLEQLFEEFHELETTPLDFFNRSSKELKNNRRFSNDFLIIIDPVDKNRNLAASISERAYRFALYQIKKFQKDPSIAYFTKTLPKSSSPADLSRYSQNMVVIEFKSDGTLHYTEIRDRLYSVCEKLRKLLEKEKTGERRFGNTLFEVFFEGNFYSAVFICAKSSISSTYLRKGPPKTQSTNVRQFCAKHADAHLQNGYYYAQIKRAYQKPLELISHFFQNYKTIEGLTLTNIAPEARTSTGKHAVSLMLYYILPLYKVTIS